MKFEYYTPDRNYRYEFVFDKTHEGYVDIHTYERGSIGRKAWLHKIVDGNIIWRYDDFMCLTQGAKDYISRIVKLKSFW